MISTGSVRNKEDAPTTKKKRILGKNMSYDVCRVHGRTKNKINKGEVDRNGQRAKRMDNDDIAG